MGAIFDVGSGVGPLDHAPIVKATVFVKSRSSEGASVIRLKDEATEAHEATGDGEGTDANLESGGAGASSSRSGRGSRGLYRFFVVYETDMADILVTERPNDGSASWEENPGDIEERYACARVFRATDCAGTGVLVRDVRAHYKKNKSAKLLSSRRYAELAYERVGGSPAVVTGPGGLLQLPGVTPSASSVGLPQGPPPDRPHRFGQPPPQQPQARQPVTRLAPGAAGRGNGWNPWMQQPTVRPHPAVARGPHR